jgi:hypothetical protein
VTVDPGDADGLAAALGELLDAPERRAELGRAGRERVEQLFDIRTVARQMDEFIEACLGEGRGQAQLSDPGHEAAVAKDTAVAGAIEGE